MKKTLLSLCFTALAATSMTASAQTKIKFATEPTYPPFEFVDANNVMQGFDIDLARALCAEMQAECTFHNQGFDSLIPTLKMGKYDAAIAAMDITEARLKQVNFSDFYYDNAAIFVVTKDNDVANVEALAGKRVGVQNGTTHQQYITDNLASITSVPYASYQDAFLDLKSGRIQAVFGDTAVISDLVKKDPAVRSLGQAVTNPKYFGNGFGIAVAKSKPELVKQLNEALKTVKASGKYQEIYAKYFAE